MGTLSIEYDKSILTVRCDIITYIEYDRQRNKITIKSSDGSLNVGADFPSKVSVKEGTDIYLKLCEYVFYGQAKYGENYRVTLRYNGVGIDMVGDTASKATPEIKEI